MLIEGFISELDIHHASASIWREMNYIDEDTYKYLISLDKHTRVVKSGLLQKDRPELYDALIKGYDLYIGKLRLVNNITDDMILERVKDAIWLINFIPEYRKFGKVEFLVKGIYVLYFKYNNTSFYLEYFTNKLKTRGVKKMDDHPLLKLVEEIMVDYTNGDRMSIYDKLHAAKANLKKDLGYYGEEIGPSGRGSYNLSLILYMIQTFIT